MNRIVLGSVAALFVTAGQLVAQGGPTYQRPTTMIVPAGLPDAIGTALQNVCADKCSATRLGGRTFSEGVVAASVSPATGSKADSALAAALAPTARTLILRQFGAEQNFSWSPATLSARAEYGMTYQAARSAVQAEMGPDAPYLPLLTANYIFVVGGASEPKMKTKKDEVTVESSIKVAVFKVAYADASAARSAIGPFYCGQGCGDRAARQQAFSAYVPPLTFVTSFSVEASGTGKGNDAAHAALATDLLENIIDELADKDMSFAVSTPVISTTPVGAMIGTREGIQRRTRFYSYEGGERRGVFVVTTVADNSAGLIDRSDVGGAARVAAVDTTRFKRVYPGQVARGHTLRERPSEVTLAVGYFGPGTIVDDFGSNKEEGSNTITLEARYEGGLLPLPPRVKPMVSYTRYGSNSSQQSLGYVQVGAGAEFYPLNGRIRLLPFLMGGKQISATDADGNDLEAAKSISATFGIDFGIRLTPEIEIGASWRNAGLAASSVDEFGDVVVDAYQYRTFGFGVRLQRGRWGL